MAKAAESDHVFDLGTGYSWWVTFDGYPRYDGIAARLYPLVHALEIHGLREWDASMNWWMEQNPTLGEPVRGLRREGAVHAQTIQEKELPTKLFISSSGSWSYSGPDSALEILERFIAADTVHQAKMAGSDAPERHLWLWTDYATSEACAPPSKRSAFLVVPPSCPTR